MSMRSVLCVDDETKILSALQRLLRREGYSVLTAAGGVEALELLETEDVQVVVSDQQMPGMVGTELLARVRERHPDIVRVILSGQADVRLIAEAIERGDVYRFMSKPWNDEELRTSIRRCVEHHALLQENRELRAKLGNPGKNLNGNGAASSTDDQAAEGGLSRQILETLPIPVVGVNRAGEIILANTAAAAELSDTGLPAEWLGGVVACLSDQDGAPPRQLSIGEKRFHARFTRVEEDGEEACAIALLTLRRLWS